MSKPDEWLDLQVKIFLRWVNQRLALRSMKVDNLKGFASGEPLVALMEILSEKPCPFKLKTGNIQRMQQMDNCNNALKFITTTCGIKSTCSAENLVDGEPKAVLGLLWAIMSTYLKFQDDDEGPALSVKDSLIMWFQNQMTDPALAASIKDVTKSFHNGLVIAATIAKFRPQLIDVSSMDAKDGQANLKKAFDAATAFFGLEQYISPAEMVKLDEKCMIVFLSEFFYGIAAQRKIDLAGRRIGKLVGYVKENDELRATYLTRSARLKELLNKLETKMQDRTIDNTMSGAKQRLDGFYTYKTQEKGATVDSDYLSLETCANLLTMRLTQHHRAPFSPPAGTTLPEFRTLLKQLEESEGKTKLHLHTELNRQFKLVGLNQQHEKWANSVQAWGAAKKEYLNTKQTVESVGAANFQISQLNSFLEEAKSVRAANAAELKRGEELRAEKYEFSDKVTAREKAVSELNTHLDALEVDRRKVADDDLQRELFKEMVNGLNAKHIRAAEGIQSWYKEKHAFLSRKEEIKSIADAELHLSLLRSYLTERKDLEAVRVPPLQQLGVKILGSEYKSAYSQWSLPEHQALRDREAKVVAAFPELDGISTKKLATLEDDLEREKYRESKRQENVQHKKNHAQLKAWVGVQSAYLEKTEPVKSISDAQENLATLAGYVTEKDYTTKGAVASMKHLGVQIQVPYKSALSNWQWETPTEIQAREQEIDSDWKLLDELYQKKHAILKDDLAREEFKERLRLDNENHQNKHRWLTEYGATSTAYLTKKDPVDSIADANNNLATLEAFETDKNGVTDFNVASLKKLGASIIAARYVGLTKYQFESPQEITAREAAIDATWAELSTLSAAKKAVLEEDLAREKKKEELRLQFADAAADLGRWAQARDEENLTTHFGFVLKEVEDFKSVLADLDKQVTSNASSKLEAAKAIHSIMTGLGVHTNTYTTATPASLDAAVQAVQASLKARQARYESELAKHRANDELCRQFAKMVEPFAQNIEKTKDLLTSTADANLETQLALINKTLQQDDSEVKNMEAHQAKMDAAGISFNLHTLLTATDARLMWNSYQSFLNAKKKAVEEEILANKMRGMSQEQMDEINKMFNQFDVSKNQFLDKREFKACLYSLGDERGAKEIQAIMKQYSDKGQEEKGIPYNGFLEFMITQLGDTDSKEEILVAFGMINGDISPQQKKQDQLSAADKTILAEQLAKLIVCQEARMLKVMKPDEIGFIKATHAGPDNTVRSTDWVSATFEPNRW